MLSSSLESFPHFTSVCRVFLAFFSVPCRIFAARRNVGQGHDDRRQMHFVAQQSFSVRLFNKKKEKKKSVRWFRVPFCSVRPSVSLSLIRGEAAVRLNVEGQSQSVHRSTWLPGIKAIFINNLEGWSASSDCWRRRGRNAQSRVLLLRSQINDEGSGQRSSSQIFLSRFDKATFLWMWLGVSDLATVPSSDAFQHYKFISKITYVVGEECANIVFSISCAGKEAGEDSTRLVQIHCLSSFCSFLIPSFWLWTLTRQWKAALWPRSRRLWQLWHLWCSSPGPLRWRSRRWWQATATSVTPSSSTSRAQCEDERWFGFKGSSKPDGHRVSMMGVCSVPD